MAYRRSKENLLTPLAPPSSAFPITSVAISDRNCLPQSPHRLRCHEIDEPKLPILCCSFHARTPSHKKTLVFKTPDLLGLKTGHRYGTWGLGGERAETTSHVETDGLGIGLMCPNLISIYFPKACTTNDCPNLKYLILEIIGYLDPCGEALG